MVEYKSGDIFAENVEALVNSVNCFGIMGRGIALQFKRKFPENFKAYEKACQHSEVQPGRMFVFKTGLLTNPQYIINFPTKRHWRAKSRIEDIKAGLESLVTEIFEREILSIALPPLGSDLGGLDWDEVAPLIEKAFDQLRDVHIVVFEPGSGPADLRPNPSTNVPRMTPGRAALVALMEQYLVGLLDPFVTLLEIHKLMYFLQLAGEPLRLEYKKAQYGPYAPNLRHVLRDIEGHLVSGYLDGGDDPTKHLQLVPGAIEEAKEFLDTSSPETVARFGRVASLVEGFESSFGLELLATVHWVATSDPEASEDQVVADTYAWNPRKKQFSERQIKLALDVLREKEWLAPTP